MSAIVHVGSAVGSKLNVLKPILHQKKTREKQHEIYMPNANPIPSAQVWAHAGSAMASVGAAMVCIEYAMVLLGPLWFALGLSYVGSVMVRVGSVNWQNTNQIR